MLLLNLSSKLRSNKKLIKRYSFKTIYLCVMYIIYIIYYYIIEKYNVGVSVK